jgi:phosphoribosylglycinamide formyltransferase
LPALPNANLASCAVLCCAVQLIPVQLCHAFKRKMLNIHPGLLPSFGGKGYYGERVHQAVLASGARCACMWLAGQKDPLDAAVANAAMKQ